MIACQKTAPEDELQVELEGVSMGNKTLIIGVLDNASEEDNGLLQLFLQSLREGENTEFLIKHILFLASDHTSYSHCKLLQLHCFPLYNEKFGISSTNLSLGANWRETLFLGEVLKRGYSFIFTRMDVMWLRNPFPWLKHNAEDLQLSPNTEDEHPLGHPNDSINNGFFFVSSNNKTIALFTHPNSEGNKEDDTLLHHVNSEGFLQNLGIKVKYLDTTYFSSFCQAKLDSTKLTTLHANCCPSIKAKIADLTAILDVWRRRDNGTSNVRFPAHSSCTQSWKLKTELQGASMANKTVIISYLNKAYVEENGMLDLFLRSLKEGEGTKSLIKHLFLFTVDQIAFDRCKQLNLHCYQVFAEGVNFSKEQIFMSQGYLNLVWMKVAILREVLKHGYSFVFTDMDIIWLRNPFSKLNLYGEEMQISCDAYNGRAFDASNNINTGFFFVASNSKTIELFDMWLESRKHRRPRMNDQDGLAFLKSRGVFWSLGLRTRFLDTRYFSGFCEAGKNMTEVITLHANCCRTMKAKIDDLSANLETWKKLNGTSAGRLRHPACLRSWSVPKPH
ncbi:hypothetical protein Cni_G14340 [Canna indica]|uniref:Nucleotide-diphospho-sugar transferase domain-containing protein n=1 Tax=Canna indica TaxID=4628 RepID=A0AAQ3QDK2_9LILI|nr:hypothetical protein Cni_G14340 [Canna indica]